MNFSKLEESGVLSITLDQAHLYFEMVVFTENGTKYKLSAWNSAGGRLEVSLGALHIRAHRMDTKGTQLLASLNGYRWWRTG